MPPKKRNQVPTIHDCKIMGEPITMEQEEWERDETEEQITVMVISKLLKSKSSMVQKIMLDANLDAKRRLNLKIVYNNGDKGLADIKVERPHHEYAIAHYLFKKSSKIPEDSLYDPSQSFMKRHKLDCSTCRDPQTSGPFMECQTFDDARDNTDLKGACMNCYYTGTSTGCSHRKKYEEEKKNKEMRTLEKVKEDIKTATMTEVNTWLPIIKHEQGSRAQSQADAFNSTRTPKK